MFALEIKEGTARRQGHIVARDEDVVWMELFSWGDGRPIETVPITITELLSWRLFGTNEGLIRGIAKATRDMDPHKGDGAFVEWEEWNVRIWRMLWGNR
jgi:hypothetical protein